MCHVELTATLITWNYQRQSITFHKTFLIFFIQFPTTNYTMANKCIWCLNNGALGVVVLRNSHT